MAPATAPRRASFGNNSPHLVEQPGDEMQRLRQTNATLTEQLDAKEMVLQEVLGKLAVATERASAAEAEAAGAAKAAQAPALGRASSASSASSVGAAKLAAQVEVMENAMEEMAKAQRERDLEIARLRDALGGARRARGLSPAAAAPTNPEDVPLRRINSSKPGGRGGDSWTLEAFLDSLNLSGDLATALLATATQQQQSPSSDLDFVMGLAAKYGSPAAGRAALADMLHQGGVVEAVAARIWQAVDTMTGHSAGDGGKASGASSSSPLLGTAAAGSGEAQWRSGHLNKFLQEGDIMMSYSSLDTFFSGLEGRVGAPSPKVEEAMAEEHTRRGDSSEYFEAGNYGCRTTSLIEWAFVASPESPPPKQAGGAWPKEAKNAQVDGVSVARRPLPLKQLEADMNVRNATLRLLNEPVLTLVEAMGGRLYTGPLFAKYNAVLRGLDSKVPVLLAQMFELCCPKAVYLRYMGGATPRQTPRGSIDDARAQLNTYTTTLHVINSAIVKLSKLTYAHKVYRGVANRALPKEFWHPNEYGVKGGIEGAFMSTTTDRDVAMEYARGDGSKAGLVFEIQQGMVDRGADIGWLSQYPHEKEIIFAPLTGFEIKYSRVEGQVLVVVVSLSVNLTAQTIEQVVSKRRKLMTDMADNIAITSTMVAQTSPGWAPLRQAMGDDAAVEAASGLLRGWLRQRVDSEPPEFYNVNANLVDGAAMVLGVAEAVEGWGDGLQLVLDEFCALNKARYTLADLLALDSLDLSRRKIGVEAAYGVAALVYLSASLREVILADNRLGDSGVAAIATALSAKGRASGMKDLVLTRTGAGVRAGRALLELVRSPDTTLTRLVLTSNPELEADARQELEHTGAQRKGAPLKLVL